MRRLFFLRLVLVYTFFPFQHGNGIAQETLFLSFPSFPKEEILLLI